MNLLYLSEDYSASKVHHELLKRLSNMGVYVNVFSVVRLVDRENDLRNKYDSINYKVYTTSISPIADIPYKFLFSYKKRLKYKKLLELIDIESIDFVHAATLFSEGCVAYEIYKRYKIPYTVAIRGTDINLYLKNMPHLWRLGRRILKNAYKIVFITNNIQNQFSQKYPIRGVWQSIKAKSVIIPNGIEDFWISHQRFENRAEKPRKILYIGRFDKNKNVESLIHAVLKLRSFVPDIQLSLVGGGDVCHDSIINLCNHHPDAIRYFGKIYDKDRLLDVFKEHDIFAMVSHSETFGLVYIEALSQNLPILYTKGQGIDGCFNKRIGEATLSTDIDDISAKLSLLINNYEQYETIEDELERFSWDTIALQYSRIFKK